MGEQVHGRKTHKECSATASLRTKGDAIGPIQAVVAGKSRDEEDGPHHVEVPSSDGRLLLAFL